MRDIDNYKLCCKVVMETIHGKWLADCADRLVASIAAESTETWKHYANVAHQIAQSRPYELRDFVLSYPRSSAHDLAPLLVIAWRIVGNEYLDELGQRAAEEIFSLCDIDEAEKASERLT